MRFHEKFGTIHKGVLRQTRQLMEYDLSDDPSEVIEKYDTWAAGVCDAYNIPVVRVEMHGCEALGGFEGGAHMTENGVIVLTRPSLLVLFHQFRHHMQAHGRSDYHNPEVDAHGWACSLLFQTNPDLFRRLVFEYAVAGVRMEDLAPEVIAPQPVSLLSDDEQTTFEDIEDRFIASLEPDSELMALMEEIAEDGT